MTRKGIRRPVEQTARYKAYNAIMEYALAHRGNTPTGRTLAKLMRKSESAARKYIHDLVQDGLLEFENGEIVVVGSRWYPPRRLTKRGTTPSAHVGVCTG